MNTYYLNWKRQFVINKHMSHPINLNLIDNERDTIEERENVLEEIPEPTDEDLKELEAQEDGGQK
jgi:hypothetical protein